MSNKVKFSNNGISVLASPIGIGATAFSVTSSFGALFPVITTGEYFYIRLGIDSDNEVVKVTAKSGDNFTCEATTKAWSADTDVVLTIPAEALEEFLPKNAGGETLTGSVLDDYEEETETPSSSSGSITIDFSKPRSIVTLTENVTSVTISNPPSSGKAGSKEIKIIQNGTGGYSWTWPASVDPGDGDIDLLTAANDETLYVLSCDDNGTSYEIMKAWSKTA